MSSPNIFLSSSPPRRSAYHQVGSSSPGLPPLQDILSQRPNQRPLQSGSRAAPIPENATTSFISAANLHRSTQIAAAASTSNLVDITCNPSCDADTSVPVIDELPKPIPVEKPRAPRRRKDTLAATADGDNAGRNPAGKVAKPRKKRQEKGESGGSVLKTKMPPPKVRSKPGEGSKCTGTMSRHFGLEAEARQPSTLTKLDPSEPLRIEPAMTRRTDWTPPTQKTIVDLDSGSSAVKHLNSSGIGGQTLKFKDLLQGYTCQGQELQAAAVIVSDEDSSFLKKRKLIEVVTTSGPISAAPASPDRSSTKQKPPKKAKKKPRTITGIATAAYKPLTQPDPAELPASLLSYFPGKEAEKTEPKADSQKVANPKPMPKKRARKASKKKAPPPKPILISPGTALAQVANQDFVFGTSSQLAREPSPTTLRNIQAAIKHSNTVDDEFATPINSDAIEPLEQRPKLWEAGARDAEGDLFDIEVINLVDGSPQLQINGPDSDPFGYFRGDDEISHPTPVDESFETLSDIFPSKREVPKLPLAETLESFSDSDMSTGIDIQRPVNLHLQDTESATLDPTTDPVEKTEGPLHELNSHTQQTRPAYDIFTDVQLAKEVTSYGFKPVKRRNAMIALLNQCWNSKARMSQASLHTSAHLSTSSKSGMTDGVASPKRARGRPRKNSVSASEPQEPPPSAQPASSPSLASPVSPKRPRGRPRKNAISPISSQSQVKAKSLRTAVARGQSTRKLAGVRAQPIIEIPDSASDIDSFVTSSPSSAPETMFSSPSPLDLSLNEETEASLVASSSDQQAAMFGHITKAVTTAPRTTDPENPSWHEKILLYDPVILEDLTAWLNSGQLSRVGCDEETNPVEVKKWCESKSVCCLWRINLRGKERKRF